MDAFSEAFEEFPIVNKNSESSHGSESSKYDDTFVPECNNDNDDDTYVPQCEDDDPASDSDVAEANNVRADRF